MSDPIVWKEAKSHSRQLNRPDPEGGNIENSLSDLEGSEQDKSQDRDEDDNETANITDSQSGNDATSNDIPTQHVQSLGGFSHHQINLSLERNITKLADSTQHKPKPSYVVGGQTLQSFDQWIEGALLAISPTADIILFSSQSPEKTVFIAKLRKEPVNQYTTKALDIPLDYDEQVTSLLCVPIMSIQRTSLGLVDWTALVVGLSSGYIKFYTEKSICLLSLKFCDEPVLSIKLQTQKVNTNARSQNHFASIVDELFIAHQTCAIVLDGIGLYENLRISKEDVVKNKLNYEPAYNITNLPTMMTCQKWKFEGSQVIDADLLGMRSTSRFDMLKSDSISHDHVPSKACTRTLVLVGRDPFLSCYREAKDTVSHSYTGMISSLLPFWRKPQPNQVQCQEMSCSSTFSMFDKGRLGLSIIPSPDKRLAAMTDDFGRVMLIDVTNWLVVRLWKGYRNAQCGWVEVERDSDMPETAYASFLVIYAPKRGLLEVWSAQRGPRVAAFNVGKSCRLLYAGHQMLNMRAEAANKMKGAGLLTNQSYSHNCYLLDAKSETLFAIEVPYSYSLYKYGDIKSRDRLLVVELSTAIHQDADVTSLSGIIQHIALAESLQIAIYKLATNLFPDKIVPIMENLINKIMKGYDNQTGETMSCDDQSILELCKRVIRLCSMYTELSDSEPSDISLPEVNQRLIEQYEEHPQEVDEFAERLGWNASEVLRYLSLIALEKSFTKGSEPNLWPNTGEPLAWSEFVDCFDLERNTNYHQDKQAPKLTGAFHQDSHKMSIKLKELSVKFLKEDKVIKTSILMYRQLSEQFHQLSANSPESTTEELREFNKCYAHLDPSSRLILLFQFWLSSKLSVYWKMWAFLQQQVGMISDELRVIAMTMDSDDLLVESWKRIYQLILESDNIYAAIIATAVIRSDTLRMITDNEKREKLARDQETAADSAEPEATDHASLSIDWECLCVDAERMSIFSQQLEDIFLLRLLLRYSPNEAKLVDNFVYRVARISVANILRAGPTVVSELLAQWVVQTDFNLKTLIKPYGVDETDQQASKLRTDSRERLRLLGTKFPPSSISIENTRELLHHVKTSFPQSLEPDLLLLNCLWEFCNRYIGSQTAEEKKRLLDRALECWLLLSDPDLQHNSAGWAYKTFFQQTFERLTIIIETNSTILSPKRLLSRDTLCRRELNMGENCLEDLVSFCFRLSDFMLCTCRSFVEEVDGNQTLPAKREDLERTLLAIDEWWSTLSMVKPRNESTRPQQCQPDWPQYTEVGHTVVATTEYDRESPSPPCNRQVIINRNHNNLVSASLSSTKLFNVNFLIELNRLARLMLLVFKLRLIKTYPLSIIGEESRQTLGLDLQQSPTMGADMKTRSGLLNDLRRKFARKCTLSIVAKIAEATNEFDEGDALCVDERDNQPKFAASAAPGEDIDTDDDGKQLKSAAINNLESEHHQLRRRCDIHLSSGSEAATGPIVASSGFQQQYLLDAVQTEPHESMSLFTHLLSLACDWQIDSDELHLDLVFELYRYNQDQLATHVADRTSDKQTLANGLLKIASQRVLVLFGLSSQVSSSNQWSKRVDKWSLFPPSLSSWLKSVQEEEKNREIAHLYFSETSRSFSSKRNGDDVDDYDEGNPDDLTSAYAGDLDFYIERLLGLRLHVLSALCDRTRVILEKVTNYLDGQANRLAYEMLQLLESGAPEKFLENERKLLSQRMPVEN